MKVPEQRRRETERRDQSQTGFLQSILDALSARYNIAAPPRISFRQRSLWQSFRVPLNRVRPDRATTLWITMRALKLNC
ncbi:MAG: hypothetical protein QG577_2341 [Thermodesulfobacteriota bacterium]|nr:hypothetical protein [Thermodesulfobacteriota bacterium]